MKILILVIFNTILWIGNSVSFWQTTVDMPSYQLFLLWFTLIPYILIFIPLLFIKRFRDPFREVVIDRNYIKIHIIYILYAFLSAGDSVLEMISGPHIGGIIQAILSASIPLPTVGLLAWVVLKQRFGRWEILGSILVIVASILQITLSSGIYYDSVLWILGFGIGLIIGSIYTVIWEIAFSWYGASPIALMIWSTIYSIPIYGAIIGIFGLTQTGFWQNQSNAIECFFHTNNVTNINNITNTTNICSSTSWISVTTYSLTSIASDLVQIYLVSFDTAFFLIISDALSTPIIAMIFSLPFFGKDTEPLTWQSIVSVVLISLGMIIYKFETIKEYMIKYIAKYKDKNLKLLESSESTIDL
jgi:hypothetical protein